MPQAITVQELTKKLLDCQNMESQVLLEVDGETHAVTNVFVEGSGRDTEAWLRHDHVDNLD